MRIQADQLSEAVNEILDDYADEAKRSVDEVVTEVANEAKAKLRTAGTYGGTGKYRKSFKTVIEKSRIGVTATVYNTRPRPLEFGHALRKGGRTVGSAREFPHMEPVNEWAQAEVMKQLEDKL